MLPAVVTQHIEEAAHLREVRAVLVRAPHVRLLQLGRLDERIAAHLDGLAVAGEAGLALAREVLAAPDVGGVFTLAVLALERRDAPALSRLLGVVAAEPAAGAGLASAFGWVPAPLLQGVSARLLGAAAPLPRRLGLAACAMHRVDPGPALRPALVHADAGLRLTAARVAAAAGRVDVRPVLREHALADDDPRVRLAAACAALLLGERGAVLAGLQARFAPGAAAVEADEPGPLRRHRLDAQADALTLMASELPTCHALLRGLAARAEAEPAARRRLVRGLGVAGDTQAMPYLLAQCRDDRYARLAGEAIGLMCGVDLAGQDLERKPPEDLGDGALGGPTEDPADEDVSLDEDERLPWPDADRLEAWWRGQAARLAPGRRRFMGEAPGRDAALRVLREGGQRQRALAAQWMPLLQPGQAVFPIAAPTRRQRRWLAAMDMG